MQKANAARAAETVKKRRGSIFRDSFYGSVKLVSSKLVSSVSFRQANDTQATAPISLNPPISWFVYRYSNPWFLPDPDTPQYKFFDAKFSKHPDIS